MLPLCAPSESALSEQHDCNPRLCKNLSCSMHNEPRGTHALGEAKRGVSGDREMGQFIHAICVYKISARIRQGCWLVSWRRSTNYCTFRYRSSVPRTLNLCTRYRPNAFQGVRRSSTLQFRLQVRKMRGTSVAMRILPPPSAHVHLVDGQRRI
jgi:hypothetical protein